jgi:uncharacterized protein (TIGR01777 family)
VIRDEISYRLPLGIAGRVFGSGIARRTIESMFSYRHQVTRDDLELFADYPKDALRIAVSGSNGMVGGQLSALLTLLGHEVQPIVRSLKNGQPGIAAWSDSSDEIQKLRSVDAVVHLAGMPVADKRWTDKVKREIRDSRWIKTRQLCERLASLSTEPDFKPRVLVCASATGLYGDRGDEILSEQSTSGDDFLANVAEGWEEACRPAVEAGIRVVNIRLGIVLSLKGGALTKMTLPAKFAGGSLGNGKQWWSWIALDDVLGAIYHAIHTPELEGPVNFVSPEPIRNRDFARVLGDVISRPAIFPAPAFALRLALGEMADALLLASTRVVPAKLQETDYKFRFSSLHDALSYSLGVDRLESVE